ncbi:MAG: hypothetical protein IPP96_14620 [Chitinophagaceae bacterium]|nr:hypothetical protein [Chitinophagaceae bacterium]
MEKEVQTKKVVRNINKPAYIIFLLAGIYFMIVKDFSQASIFLGLAWYSTHSILTRHFLNDPFIKRHGL